MRTIEYHKGDPCNDAITIEAGNQVAGNGAPQMYYVTLRHGSTTELEYRLAVPFQMGDSKHGVNGLTNEVLIAIVADRLEQVRADDLLIAGENERILWKLHTALEILDAQRRRPTHESTDHAASPQ